MLHRIEAPSSLADVLGLIDRAELSTTQRRDMKSAINRLCEMAGQTPSSLSVDVPALREIISKVRPAAHGITDKTFSNMRSLVASALIHAGIVDPMERGRAKRHPAWAPLIHAIMPDKRLSNGMACFANWCAANGMLPDEVNDIALQDFLAWLNNRTLSPKPHDVVRRVPNIWNQARASVEGWPQIELLPLSFRPPSDRLAWDALSNDFQHDAEAYLLMRAEPDLFDDRPNAPKRPLAPATLRQQREHLRLSASVLVKNGSGVEDITSLANLVQSEAFKTILRFYHKQAGGEPKAFVISLAQTLVQVAQYHVSAAPEQVAELKALAAKLPTVPFDLTEKNKKMLRAFESEQVRAKLLFLPEQLIGEVACSVDKKRFPFVAAQVAIAVDIALVAPLRPQNLAALNWGRHFNEPDGPRGRLQLHIPASETKTRKRELVFEVPEDVAQRIRWYRRHVLPRLGADTNGDLFVTQGGITKNQKTLAQQIIKTIECRVGARITPHQFRHLAAALYLEQQPQDFETVRALLGHAYGKTTLIYAGSSSRRASRSYNDFVIEQREVLKLKRKRRVRRK